MKQTFKTENELLEYARRFSRSVVAGDILALSGDLGAGKTTFTKGLVAGLGYAGTVTSPTFNLVHRYVGGSIPVIHYDLYRLKKPSEIVALDLDDEVEEEATLLVIEWPDLIFSILPAGRTRSLTFRELPGGFRELEMPDDKP